MPGYRRNAKKRTFKRRPRRRYTRRTKSLVPLIKKTINSLADTKYYTEFIDQTPMLDTNFTTYLTAGKIVQGTADDERIGSTIMPRYLLMNMIYENLSTTSQCFIRTIIYTAHNGAPLASGDLLNSTSSYAQALKVLNYSTIAKIYYDKTIHLGQKDVDAGFPWAKHVKIFLRFRNLRVEWTSNGDAADKNQLYYLVCTNIGDFPNVSGYYRIAYKDQ